MPARALKVLVPIDFSELSRRALARVIAMASLGRFDVHVLHVNAEPCGGVAPGEIGERLAHGLRTLDEALDRTMVDGERPERAAVRTHVYAGDPAAEILKLAARVAADMIVMGTHGRSGAGGPLMGSVATRVVRQALCPVLCVTASAAAADAADAPAVRKILCAVDFSDTSRRAMRAAVELARQVSAALIVVHVPHAGPPVGREDPERTLASWQREAEARGVTVSARVIGGGSPAIEIVRFADLDLCDVIVVGTHGRTGRAPLMGSVAESVLRTATCPVLMVHRSPGRSRVALVAGVPDQHARAPRI